MKLKNNNDNKKVAKKNRTRDIETSSPATHRYAAVPRC